MNYIVVIWIGNRKGIFFRFRNRVAANNLKAEMKKRGHKTVLLYDLNYPGGKFKESKD